MRRLRRYCITALIMVAALSASAGGYDSFRMMSFNICHCATHYSLSVTDEDVRRTASVIAAENPEFVCLQEVDKETTRSNGIDETARFAELLTEATGDEWHGVFGKGRDYQGGEFGVAILSKKEPLSVSKTPIEGTEQRCLLVCEFDDFCVATVHLDNNRDYRMASVGVVSNVLAGISKPVFIAGDWNATPSSETLLKMKEFLTVISPESGIVTLNSQIGVRDEYVIDYIAVDTQHSGNFFVRRGYTVSNMVGDARSSDHDPVIVDVVRRPAAADLAWIEENAVTTGMTGEWARPVRYDAETLKAELGGENSFAPQSSDVDSVTIDAAISFYGTGFGEESLSPLENAKAAVTLGEAGFLLWTADGWVGVAATGISPQIETEYSFRFIFDYSRNMFSALVRDGETLKPLVDGNGKSEFPLAGTAKKLSALGFSGEGSLSSIYGECALSGGFSEGEKITLFGGDEVALTSAQAEWLNGLGGKAPVATAAAALTFENLTKAWLLNLDITNEGFEGCTFAVTGFTVHQDCVDVAVTLTRCNDDNGKAIYGSLKFYGATTLEALMPSSTELGAENLANGKFDGGMTATATIPLEGEIPPAFFRATIEAK